MTKKVKLYLRIWALILACAMMLSSCSVLEELLEFDIEEENAAPLGSETTEDNTDQYSTPVTENGKIIENVKTEAQAGKSGEVVFTFEGAAGVSGLFTVDKGVTVNSVVVTDANGKQCDDHDGQGEIRIFAFDTRAKLTTYTVTVSYTLDEDATGTKMIVFEGETSDETGRIITPRVVNIKINVTEPECQHKDIDPADHECDLCQMELTKCEDKNKDHYCDVCASKISECVDNDNNHKCDFCNTKLTVCEDGNSDHNCDYCGTKLTECSDNNSDHNCDICGARISECVDNNRDHICDICGIGDSECADNNNDHCCDLCGEKLSNCADDNNDHNCDVCGEKLTNCADGNNDHKCDLCRKKLTDCADNNNDHDCDICGKGQSKHADNNSDHNCDICGKKITNCVDDNDDHKCDVCDVILSECEDANDDHKCDVCDAKITSCIDNNNDRVCDVCENMIGSVGLSYSISNSKTCTITGIGTCTDTDIVIPTEIDGYRVVRIAEKAFFECSSITSVIIPDSVTYIGAIAFHKCQSLESINIPDGVELIYSYTFATCPALTSITIPNGVRNIYHNSFRSCRSLESITISDSVTTIQYDAFRDCPNLSSINYNGTIEQWQSITFGENWNNNTGHYIIYCTDGNIYSNCVDDNGDNTCDICGASLESGNNYSSGLEYSVNSDGTTCTITGIGTCTDTELIIPEEIDGYRVTKISNNAFANNEIITSVLIPDSVYSIGSKAFYKCYNLETINIPYGITSINNSTFWRCKKLVSIDIPETVTSIGGSAFYDCENLSCVNGGWGIASVSSYAFGECDKLQDADFIEGVLHIGDGAFSGTALRRVLVSDNLISMGDHAFGVCDALIYNEYDNAYYIGSITNPYMIFIQVKDLDSSSCEIHKDTRFLHSASFSSSKVVSITLPNGIQKINGQVFGFCLQLTNIDIPDGVTAIGNYVFNESALESVNLPNSITSLGVGVFSQCRNFDAIYYNGTIEQWNNISFGEDWDTDTGHYIIYCTDGNIYSNCVDENNDNTCDICEINMTSDVPATEIIFDFGDNKETVHNDGKEITDSSKTYVSGSYELVLTNISKVYDGAFDYQGNSALKLGTATRAATFTFNVPTEVNSVVINAAKYKNYSNNNILIINGTTYTLIGASSDGQYDAIFIDTSTVKTVTVETTTDSATPRAMINSIVFVVSPTAT